MPIMPVVTCVLRGMIVASVPLVVSRFVETDETTADLESRRSLMQPYWNFGRRQSSRGCRASEIPSILPSERTEVTCATIPCHNAPTSMPDGVVSEPEREAT